MSGKLIQIVKAQREHTLSPSQVAMFLDCAFKWYCAHVLNLPHPPNGVLALGRALHAIFATVLREQQRIGVMPAYDAALRIFGRFLLEEIKEAQLGKDESTDQLADVGAAVLLKWHRDFAPKIQVAALEQHVTGRIGGVDVQGFIDLEETNELITDFKSAARKPWKVPADTVLQVTTYAMLKNKETARIVTITKTLQPAIVQHTIQITPALRKYAEEIYPIALAGMQSGVYPPHRGSNLCSRKHCPFVDHCVAEFGGNVQ